MPGPVAAVWLVVLASSVALVWASPTGNRRRRGPSWFDILPHLTESKKARTRAQQTPAHRRRRNRR